ncbi:MAG: ECF RNA polymerase sigma factor SigW [Planctomycetes bacterium]|nr:ECF RNA polymerase sigma factor SigW [Planctomycetota bacterium]
MHRPGTDAGRTMTDAPAGFAEDAELVLLARGGDRSAFGRLAEKYAGVVRALVTARLGRSPEAEDAAQDVFLAAFERLPSLADPERFAGWLSTIATHRALEELRRRKRRAGGPLAPATGRGGDGGSDDSADRTIEELADPGAAAPGAAMERAEETRTMLGHLAELDERTRIVLLLRFREGQAVKDIAAALGEQPPAVAMRISRALRKLRERMEDGQ